MVIYQYPSHFAEHNASKISIDFLETFLLFLIDYMDKSGEGNIQEKKTTEENILNSLYLLYQIYTNFSHSKLIFEGSSHLPFFSKQELICLKKYKKHLKNHPFPKNKDKKLAQKFVNNILELDIHSKIHTEINFPNQTWIAKDISIFSANM
ncbi:hypothetical protein [Bacillus sp. FDAARGOS_1420]|uniref:hypothetical protein n=1 Tax=unclassified Bacillus (in: firmicutes) TaxID=185979 RepID=UPI001C5AAC16|nr:hypothetical protein [Bacillus sp. FDAARGOS_1420]MBW3496804.1 hypothetical protein [Bacillus sp. FDAARGOS_1420]